MTQTAKSQLNEFLKNLKEGTPWLDEMKTLEAYAQRAQKAAIDKDYDLLWNLLGSIEWRAREWGKDLLAKDARGKSIWPGQGEQELNQGE